MEGLVAQTRRSRELMSGRNRFNRTLQRSRAAVDRAAVFALEDLETRRLLSTVVQTLNFPQSGVTYGDLHTTDWTDTQTINKFNPALGTLTEVDIQYSGSMTTQIKVE